MGLDRLKIEDGGRSQKVIPRFPLGPLDGEAAYLRGKIMI